MHSFGKLVLSQCAQRCRGCGVLQSRLFSTGSTDDPFIAQTTDLSASAQLETGQLGGWDDTPEPSEASASDTSSRWFAKRHNAPSRKQMYHRRHREQKKHEKRQSRIHHLQEIHNESYAKGNTRLAEAAGGEAERLQRPWMQVNIPVKPPSYASVSAGRQQQAKVVVYDPTDVPRDNSLGLSTETRTMDVLNLKVGYAVDAQYALPAEVQAFVLDQTTFCLYGVDKNQVTQIASNIRRIRPPEPYKGAGIRIVGESVKIKDRRVK